MRERSTPEQIRLLAVLFAGDPTAALMLKNVGAAPLVCVFEYLVEEKESAFEALKASKQAVLAAFCKAVDGERASVKFLLDTQNPHWAAMANYANGDEKALAWLERNNFPDHAVLAKKIVERFRKENDENPFRNIFNSPI